MSGCCRCGRNCKQGLEELEQRKRKLHGYGITPKTLILSKVTLEALLGLEIEFDDTMKDGEMSIKGE